MRCQYFFVSHCLDHSLVDLETTVGTRVMDAWTGCRMKGKVMTSGESIRPLRTRCADSGSRVWVVLVDDKPKLSFILRLHGIFCLQASRFIVSCACRRLEKIPDEGVDDEQDDEGNDA